MQYNNLYLIRHHLKDNYRLVVASLLSYTCTSIVLLELVYYLVYWYILYVTLLYCCYLIQKKATPAYVAAQNGHIEALSVLISAGADFNAANKVSYSKYFGKQDISACMMSQRVEQHSSVGHTHITITSITKVTVDRLVLFNTLMCWK